MQTNNFAIHLMVPGQIEKDIVFNESILKIDQFFNNCLNGFIDTIPDTLNIGEKFIIVHGERKNQICYRLHETKEIEFLQPKANTIFFSIEHQSFLIFQHDNWVTIDTGPRNDSKFFTGIKEQYTLPRNKSTHYLYLSDPCRLILEKPIYPEITIILKQNTDSSKKLTWPHNVLWQNKVPHMISDTNNSIDIIKLIALPKCNYFLGQIIGQNYQF